MKTRSLLVLFCLGSSFAFAETPPQPPAATTDPATPAPVSPTPSAPSPTTGETEARKEKQKARWEKAFTRLDANADGELTKDEFQASPHAKKKPERAAKRFSRWDKDHDGKLSREEWTSRPQGRKKKVV